VRYNPALDGIRAIACSVVVAHHCYVPGFKGGAIGVDVFFVLSGYLITSILAAEHERTRRIDFLAFYLRRLRRLYPALLLFLAVYLVAVTLLAPQVPVLSTLREVAAAGFYLADYTVPYAGVPKNIAHTWSLAVEEQYYLIWPALLLAVLALRRGMAIFVMASAFVIATAFRFHGLAFHVPIPTVYFTFHYHCSGLLLGSALALAQLRPPASLQPVLLFAGLVGVAICTALIGRQTTSIGFGILLAEISAALLILGARPTSILSTPWLVRIGTYSYALYLWNAPIARFVRADHSWPVTFLVVGGLSLAFSAFSYHFVEQRFRHRKARPELPTPEPDRTPATG